MSYLDHLLDRNRKYAAHHAASGVLAPTLSAAMPHVKALVIGCMDFRVDPAYILGLEPGDAVVMRNIGGRITPTALEQLGLLGRISEVAQAIPAGGGEFHLILLQHTGCGITCLAGDTARLADYFQSSEQEAAARPVTDPRASVQEDVAVLRSIPGLPPGWLLSGLVYDVATGLVEVVVPPAPLRAA